MRKVVNVMMRSKVRPGKDRKVFSRTAGATKRANVMPVVMRGGTRL